VFSWGHGEGRIENCLMSRVSVKEDEILNDG
jgi:hypothetical protein